MGYYVQIADSTAVIPNANLQRAYEKMCALNVTHHNQKRGGSWSNGREVSKHFSWMDENYPETCKDTRAVLEQLGFETEYNNRGDLLMVGYDNKTGQEDLFMEAIKHDVRGEIHWVGEDGETWTTEFVGNTVIDV